MTHTALTVLIRLTSLISATACAGLLLSSSAHAERKPPAKSTAARDRAPKKVALAVGSGAAGGSSAESRATYAPPEPERTTSPPKHDVELPALDVALGIRGSHRELSYRDDIFGMLPKYRVTAPSAFLVAEWYPLPASLGLAARFGITGSIESAIATRTAYDSPQPNQGGQTFTTTAREFTLGLRVRLPVGSSEVGVGAQYG